MGNRAINGGYEIRKPLALVLVCLCAAGFLLCAGCAAGDGAQAPGNLQARYQHVDGDEAARIIAQGECFLLDVRGQVDYDLGHIPGAVCIDFDRLDTPEAQAALPAKDARIVVYCDYGGVSKTAAETLADMGFADIVEFDGLEVWGYPLAEGPEAGSLADAVPGGAAA